MGVYEGWRNLSGKSGPDLDHPAPFRQLRQRDTSHKTKPDNGESCRRSCKPACPRLRGHVSFTPVAGNPSLSLSPSKSRLDHGQPMDDADLRHEPEDGGS